MLGGVLLGLAGAGALAAAEPPERVVIDLTPKPCTSEQADADVTVCARRPDDFRIDPGVLAGERALNAPPQDLRTGQQKAIVRDCHAEWTKCQGSGVVPLLPAALKALQAAALAAKGEDWREAFRTKPDEYQAYRAEQERRRPRVSVSVGASAREGSAQRP